MPDGSGFFCPCMKSLDRKVGAVAVHLLEAFDKFPDVFSRVPLMGIEGAGQFFFRIEGRPGKGAAVAVEKARSDADAAVGGDVGQGRVVVGAVEVIDVDLLDDLLLQGPEDGRRAAADHEGAAREVSGRDLFFVSQGIVAFADDVEAAVKEVVLDDVGDALHFIFHGKEDVLFIIEEGLIMEAEAGRDGDAGVDAAELIDGLGEKVDG